MTVRYREKLTKNEKGSFLSKKRDIP